MQVLTKSTVLGLSSSDVSIPYVGLGRSGNRPSDRVDSGSGIAL